MRRLPQTLIPFALSLILGSCSGCSFDLLSGQRVTLLTYNVENLFDDVDNGTEYREYDPSNGGWTTELFHRKLQRIAEVLRSVAAGGADIAALQEVESEKALAALNDRYLKGMGYRPVLGRTEGAAVSVGLLCRLPVSRVTLHRVETEDPVPLRSILEVEVEVHGGRLVLLVNHWKSKEGDGEPSERLRRASAAVVARRLQALRREEPAARVVVLGDLNERYDEFDRSGRRYRTALMPADATATADGSALAPETASDGSLLLARDPRAAAAGSSASATLYDPWAACPDQGSIWFAGEWESIDHILIGPTLFEGGGLCYESFSVVRNAFLLDSTGRPLRWDPAGGSGYSDHLPLLVTLVYRR